MAIPEQIYREGNIDTFIRYRSLFYVPPKFTEDSKIVVRRHLQQDHSMILYLHQQYPNVAIVLCTNCSVMTNPDEI